MFLSAGHGWLYKCDPLHDRLPAVAGACGGVTDCRSGEGQETPPKRSATSRMAWARPETALNKDQPWKRIRRWMRR